jgi:site-specific DNA recombinase
MQPITNSRSPTRPPVDKVADQTARAVIYLRVSGRGQLETDYDDDGLSIAGQRARCEQKAAEHHAEIVDEYVERAESAKTNDRPALRTMLERIKERHDVDYVILWKVDRFARNRRDDANMLFEIEMAGARLISATENIDQTPAGRLMHGMLASFAEYYSRNLANEVIKGSTEKAKRGGTPTYAPLGYLNVREQLSGGGEVRTIAIDPERSPIIVWGFETYATGLYSINDMVTLLAARGLRSRGNRRYASKPLNHSSMHVLLSNPYYAGVVTYRGKRYPGRHEPLISEELFEQVQAVLKAHAQSGERDRKHGHYLKGSIRCGGCKHRLTFSRNTGNGGTYEYFVCPSYQRQTCPHGYRRAVAVEALIEQHYRTVMLSAADRDRVMAALEHRLAELATASQTELDRCQNVLIGLKEQERKLLAKHYQDEISEELFSEESARIKQERKDAQAILARLTIRHEDLVAGLTLALKLASSDLHDLYLRATPPIRRLMNQAIFEVIWIDDEDHLRAELASPFKELAAINRASSLASGWDEPVGASLNLTPNNQAPRAAQAPEALVVGSISEVMVGDTGLEPVTSALSRRRSPS